MFVFCPVCVLILFGRSTDFFIAGRGALRECFVGGRATKTRRHCFCFHWLQSFVEHKLATHTGPQEKRERERVRQKRGTGTRGLPHTLPLEHRTETQDRLSPYAPSPSPRSAARRGRSVRGRAAGGLAVVCVGVRERGGWPAPPPGIGGAVAAPRPGMLPSRQPACVTQAD